MWFGPRHLFFAKVCGLETLSECCYWGAYELHLKSSGGECECHKRNDEATQALIVTVRKLLVIIEGW